MLIALLLAGAAPATAIEAERAFAADAQAIGQWSAFRRWAAADALMFLPQPVRAQDFLKPLEDPPKAVDWWPTASFVSCDGTTAANTGGARYPNGRVSYFSTIWSKNAEGIWRWKLDHGDDLKAARPRPGAPKVTHAACTTPPRGALAATKNYRGSWGGGESPDHSLRWSWRVAADGALRLTVLLWNGAAYRTVLDDQVAAPES